jgi:predicted nucleic acid-binding protein
MEVLPDSSIIIALAKTGSLDLLRKTFGEIWVTKEVEKEITSGDFPEIGEIKRGMGKWIKILKAKTTGYKELGGLDEGEKSILGYAKGRKNVLLILDEVEARAIAEGEGIPYTGTIGLIVFAYESRKISKEEAGGIVKRLSRSDFRMTVELYDWVLERLK